MKSQFFVVIAAIVMLLVQGGFAGILSSPANEGLVSDGQSWLPSGEGISVTWQVSQNADSTWHYSYTFANAEGLPLIMNVSYFIITVAEDLQVEDVFSFSEDVSSFELGFFGQDPSRSGFPVNESVYGLKIELGADLATAQFDSLRAPMWGDIYIKDGGNPVNYAYNTDFGVQIADYLALQANVASDPMFKLLVPGPVPEPATLSILTIGMLLIRKFKRY